MGAVGSGNLRDDLHRDLRDSIPKNQSYELHENSLTLSAEEKEIKGEPSRTTRVRTIKEFKSLFQKVLETATDMDGTKYPIRFVGDSPPVDAELPCFTTKLISRRPFNAAGTKELRPRPMKSVDDPDQPGNIIEQEFRRQENIIEITVWAKSSKERDKLSDWIESVFYEYIWAFGWGGFTNPVLWEGRDEDVTKQVQNQTIHGAPIRFYVVTGVITSKRTARFRHLAVKIGIYDTLSD